MTRAYLSYSETTGGPSPIVRSRSEGGGNATVAALNPARRMAPSLTGWPLAIPGSRDASAREVALTQPTIDDAAAHMALLFGRSFAICETVPTTGFARLHLFTVKRRRVWRYCPDSGTTRKVEQPYAVATGVLDIEAFEPRRPFDAFEDCPATGRQAGDPVTIEVRS